MIWTTMKEYKSIITSILQNCDPIFQYLNKCMFEIALDCHILSYSTIYESKSFLINSL